MIRRSDEPCEWSQDGEESDCWITDCGQNFYLEDGTPLGNGLKFCCFCGGPLIEELWTDEEDEDVHD